ncbi:helix-turn-helix transcriptional regulator [Paraburkholderia sp. JHI869]
MLALEQSDDGVRDDVDHAHDVGQLLGSSDGPLSVKVENDNWVIPATHCVWVPPHMVHKVRSHGPFSGWCVFLDEMATRMLPPVPAILKTHPLLREAVRRLATLPLDTFTPRHERLAGVILDELGALPAEACSLTKPNDPRLARIADAVLVDPANERGLVEWAEWAGISSRTMSRRFVEETGLSFTAWRQHARLLRALELLSQGRAVTAVSLDLGYNNVSTFIALFRRTYGITPRAYALGAAINAQDF